MIPLQPRTLATLAWTAWILWVLGQGLRDRTWLSALLFYIPSPGLAALLLLIAAWMWRKKARAGSLLVLLMAVLPLWFLLAVENNFTEPPGTKGAGGPLRLVHWNVGRGGLGWPAIEEKLLSLDADLYVLSEPPGERSLSHFADALGPETIFERRGALAVLARAGLRSGPLYTHRRRLKVWSLEWDGRGRSMSLFAVEMPSHPLVPREPELIELTALMAQYEPDIAVGDFNAPRRSRFLASLLPGYTHAYEAAGGGWSYTWPVPIPMYAIDQCIVGSRILPLRYRLETTLRSDHRAQVLDFAVRDVAEYRMARAGPVVIR